jgi:hypothetical protein
MKRLLNSGYLATEDVDYRDGYLSRRELYRCMTVSCAAALIGQVKGLAAESPTEAKSTKSKPTRIKKGICGKGAKCQLTGAGWYYNWTRNPAPGEISAEFVPMIKGHRNATDDTFAKIEKQKKSHGVTHLLGFNEPEKEKQGNTTFEQAIAKWPKLMETGLRLGSPAVTDNRAGANWLSNFMKQAAANKLRVDFIAVHKYPNIRQRNSVQQFFRSLQQIHQTYRRPIWITEFSGLNFGSKERNMMREDNLHFMRKVVPMLERLAYVERYSWYSGSDKDISCLYNTSKPNGLSPLGNLYRNLGRPS